MTGYQEFAEQLKKRGSLVYDVGTSHGLFYLHRVGSLPKGNSSLQYQSFPHHVDGYNAEEYRDHNNPCKVQQKDG